MAFNLHSNEDDVIMEINTTPLIDVMLVLLVMLIITIPPQMHAVNMNMPTTTPTIVKTPTVIYLDIDKLGHYSWNGQATGREELNEKLTSLKSALEEQPEFHIKPDKKTHYKYLSAIMSDLQKKRFTKVGIVGNERFVQD
jgi:biopolymer transport protein ExbD